MSSKGHDRQVSLRLQRSLLTNNYRIFASVVTVDDTTSLLNTPKVEKSQLISNKGTDIATADGTIHVQPFRRSGSKQLRALVTFTPRSSHFDSHEAGTDQFRGFFTLFWIFLFVFRFAH